MLHMPMRGLRAEPLEARHLLTTLVDLDADGDLDAVRANAWYENQDGLGDFSEHVFASNADAGVQVGDLDGDSDPDVITSGGDWYENVDGAGSLTMSHPWNNAADPFDVVRLIDDDFDGDLDFVAANGQEHAVLFRNDGEGTFTLQSTVDGPFVAAADFDKDGLLDKVVENEEGDFWLHRNLGNGAFETELVLEADPHVSTRIFGVTDVDGNGYEDILYVYQPSHFSYGWMGDDGEQFTGGGSLGSGDGLLFLADIDQDGDLEGVTHSLGNQLQWTFTEGNGGLRGRVSASGSDLLYLPRVTDIGDINGDGRLDFVYANATPIWLDGNELDFHEVVEPTPVGDVNGDGIFNSSDLVGVFEAGEYEDNLPLNSTWEEGDWNRDGDFDSADLVLAFQAGNYQVEAVPSESQIAAAVDWIFVADDHGTNKPRAAFIA